MKQKNFIPFTTSEQEEGQKQKNKYGWKTIKKQANKHK